MVKNIQIIDGAVNATYSIFQAPEEDFNSIFPLPDQDIEVVEDYISRVGEHEANHILTALWDRPVHKATVMGIHGTLYYDYKEKAHYLPDSRRKVDRDSGQITPLNGLLTAG